MKKITKNLFVLSLLVFGLQSCSEDNDRPEMINEEEVITSVRVTRTSGNETVSMSSVDLDGDGPNPPVVNVQGNLGSNKTYTGSIRFLNEAESPAEEITEEVAEEADEHQVFYTFSGGISSVIATDTDSNSNPLGLTFNLTTNDAGNATLGFTLRHEPKKPNAGILDAGGETDVEVLFNVVVE